MNISLYLLAILLSSLLMSCHPKPINPPDDPVDTTDTIIEEEYPIEIIWKTPLSQDTTYCESMYPICGTEKVFFSRQFCNAGQGEVILTLNKNNGNILWKYQGAENLVMYSFIKPIFEKTYLIYSANKIHAINTETGDVQWIFSGDQYNRKIEAWFYNVQNKPAIILGSLDLPWQSFQHILQLDPVSGMIIDTLFTMKRNQKTACGIANILYYKYKNGHDWILFKNRSKIADFYAFDITTDSIIWSVHDINNGNSIVHEMPVVHDGKVIFSAGTRLLCYDLDDGSLVWKVDRPSYDINLYKDVIFCYYRKNSEPLIPSYVCAYDAGTGNLLWQTEVTGEAEFSNNFIVYKDKLYFSATYLQCLDVHTGRKLWKYRPPDYKPGTNWDKSVYGEGMVIDQETGYCYISDGFFALCLNLNNVEVQ